MTFPTFPSLVFLSKYVSQGSSGELLKVLHMKSTDVDNITN